MKKNKSKKRVFKGMTLMEIIIAIAIVAVMSTVLVVAASAINSYLRSARQVNRRVADQAPVAEVGYDNAAAPTIAGGVQINLQPDCGGNINLNGKVYKVYTDEEMTAHSDEFGRGLNMKYITEIQPVTEAATT